MMDSSVHKQLHFKSVNAENRREVEGLTVFSEQTGFIESVSECLREADELHSFRPNLKNPEHQRAWEKFQSVPEGQKSQYLVQAILEKEDRKWMEEVIQKTIKESVRELGICGTTEQSTTKLSSEEIPDQMMDFLSQMENL